MDRNTPGHGRTGVPLFIAQGGDDKIVRPKITRDFVSHLCRDGDRVTFLELPGVDHMTAARKSASSAVAWIDGRFGRFSSTDTCVR